MIKILVCVLFINFTEELPEKKEFDLAIAFISGVGSVFVPCGCGKPPFKGGELSKKAFVVKTLRKKYGQKFLVFDCGNYINPAKDPDFIKLFRKTVDVIKFDGMAISTTEIWAGGGDPKYLRDLIEEFKFPYYGIFEKYKDFLKPYKFIKIKDINIIFSSWVPKFGKERTSQWEREKLKEIEKKLGKNGIFILVTPTDKDIPDIEKNVKFINVIGKSRKFEVNYEKSKNSIKLQTARFGLFLPVLFLKVYEDSIHIHKFIKIPLDNNIKKDKEILDIKKEWEKIRKTKIEQRKKELMKERGNLIIPSSRACKTCHEKEYDIWMKTKHARAFNTLKNKEKDKKNSCLSCHTTRFMRIGGFINIESTPNLINVGCMECHELDLKKHKEKGEARTLGKRHCLKCHTKKWSPDFDFENYWEKIKH